MAVFKYLSPVGCRVMRSFTLGNHCEDGQVILPKGGPGTSLCIIETGQVVLSKRGSQGKDPLIKLTFPSLPLSSKGSRYYIVEPEKGVLFDIHRIKPILELLIREAKNSVHEFHEFYGHRTRSFEYSIFKPSNRQDLDTRVANEDLIR